ncbi:MAG: phosphoserine phosphatase SerB [Archaeoglobaceae archaeon]
MQKLIAVSVFGEDKPGIIPTISGVLTRNSVNIVDIEQNVIQGLFAMFIVGDIKKCPISLIELKKELDDNADEMGLNIQVSPFQKQTRTRKKLYTLQVLGEDRVGLIYGITKILHKYGISIKKANATARDSLISIEFLVDFEVNDSESIKNSLREDVEKFGLDIVIQRYPAFRRERRLIVFDMDSTIVDTEVVVELAKAANAEEEVEELTKKAMNGEIDFKDALKQRVKLLEGLPVDVLEKIYQDINLTEGAKELIETLKDSGYKVALVSGGFTYFTEKLKKELGLDYAFGNELEIKDGKLTGELKGRIIDSREKARIIDELAQKEGMDKQNVVAVGDGANDRIMIENAGLGIAFNAKTALKEVADGVISKDNFIALASVLNLPNEFKKRI